MSIDALRLSYHQYLLDKNVLSIGNNAIPSNADSGNRSSIALARGIIKHIIINLSNAGYSISEPKPIVKLAGQQAGNLFEQATKNFVESALSELNALRPGNYRFSLGRSINEFEQYEHLRFLSEALKENRGLKAALGDYVIYPDITVGKEPFDDGVINSLKIVMETDQMANLTPVRFTNSTRLLLHASISCKWTLRSDRAQNARTEGLNLIRNRKGHTPHIVSVTGEPTLQRIASLALGTGDIDCVYHFALNELIKSVQELDDDNVSEMLSTLVEGKRLRDISDLPFDLIA